jgi:hypothetical protein
MEGKSLSAPTPRNLPAVFKDALSERLKVHPRIYDAIRSRQRGWHVWRSRLRERYEVRFVILLYPVVIHGRLYKGVLWVMGNANHIVQELQDIKNYFWLVSTSSGSQGWARGQTEDIHGLTTDAHTGDYRVRFPAGRCMAIRNADFIDEQDFYPIRVEKHYDLFFNSTLRKFKRHELFLSTLYELRDRYHREITAAVILWSGAPRLQNSRIYPNLFYRLAGPLARDREMRRYARHLRALYEKAIEDGLKIDIFDPMYRWKKDTIQRLRLLYNQSKIYLLLSQNEGLNRAAKEALLCDTPLLVIKESTTAEEFVNSVTGKAVEDNQEAIVQGILEMLERPHSYSPRSWAVEHCARARIVEKLWHNINELERVPGYPSRDEANRIRRRFTDRQADNYFDLNNWRGVASSGSLVKEMRRIRRTFKTFVRQT